MAFPTPKRITELDLASPLTDADEIAIVQANKTKRATLQSVRSLMDNGCQCTLVSRYTSVGTDANTLLKYLYTYTLPANTLDNNGCWLEIHASGYFAANGNNKIVAVRLKQDSTGLNRSYATTNTAFNDDYWSISLRVQRSGETTDMTHAKISVVSNSVSLQTPAVFEYTGDGTGTNWLSDLQICVTAQNGTASANDTTCLQFIVVAHLLDTNS